MDAASASEWWRDQVVFLTGGTGTLGGCLLYKLAIQLPTKRMFVLCRGSIHSALEKLERSMPDEINEVMDSGKVTFVVGDLSKPSLGLRAVDRAQLQQQVTVVINSAANVSLRQELQASMVDNCLVHLSLVDFVSSFAHLKRLLHVSTAYVNSFLPGGTVQEKIYHLDNKAVTKERDNFLQEVQEIVSTGQTRYNMLEFPAPYALAKYLLEQLLLDRKDNQHYSTLIIRPSNIGPALQHPHRFYGFDLKIPLHSYVQSLLRTDNHGIEHFCSIVDPKCIIDEVPVDIVANVSLLHLASGTTDIVHATSQLYVPYSLSKVASLVASNMSQTTSMSICQRGGVVLSPKHAEAFFQMLARFNRGWEFSCARSECLRQTITSGPLSLRLDWHDPEEFMRVRIRMLVHKFQKLLFNTSRGPDSALYGECV
ncbi:putative secondary metabolism biosynthetic enzyme [Aspergillus flavus]|nr:hypothetical protein AFLA_006467 [Aspergillus flavus NRRL3357]RMZ39238.1 thioester reductase family protein [Aspergillus flavus]UDD59167.1 putative secondary metabolism biosynthetic enzyme [Aspergillus flavus]GMG02136.1 unnamed protein product [Aspergillus oryzae]